MRGGLFVYRMISFARVDDSALLVILALLACAAIAIGEQEAPQPAARILDCETVFRPDTGASNLVEHFGAANVTTAEISVGDDPSEKGTVLFAGSPEDRVEIFWWDEEGQRMPKLVRIAGSKSRWETPNGITLGTDLLALEQLNGRPFRMFGFGWDNSGSLASWSGGALESPKLSPCRFGVALEPDHTMADAERQHWERQVQGDWEFSSAHPAMQALNPKVYSVMFEYSRPESEQMPADTARSEADSSAIEVDAPR